MDDNFSLILNQTEEVVLGKVWMGDGITGFSEPVIALKTVTFVFYPFLQRNETYRMLFRLGDIILVRSQFFIIPTGEKQNKVRCKVCLHNSLYLYCFHHMFR